MTDRFENDDRRTRLLGRRLVFSVVVVAVVGAVILSGVAYWGRSYVALNPVLWGAGVSNNGSEPMCRPSFWLQRC